MEAKSGMSALHLIQRYEDVMTDLKDYFEEGITLQGRGQVSLMDREVATRAIADRARAKLMAILANLSVINESSLRQNVACKIDETRQAIEAILFILDPDHKQKLLDACVAVGRPLQAYEAINLIDPQRLFCRD
jgi:ABC-type phosphate/phosphonate transport system ATPase subunit